jgi:hypothetical protein
MLAWELPFDDGTSWGQTLSYASVTLLAAVKFYVGLMAALAQGFRFWEVLLTICPGALGGIWVYTYAGDAISQGLARFWPWKRRRQPSVRYQWLTRCWHRYGLVGVAALMPVLSPQVSIALALTFRENPRRILFYMTVSVFVWTLLAAALSELIRLGLT